MPYVVLPIVCYVVNLTSQFLFYPKYLNSFVCLLAKAYFSKKFIYNLKNIILALFLGLNLSGIAQTEIVMNPSNASQKQKPAEIYITQLIYVIPGQEKVFNQFEDIAIPQISKYNGKLLLRTRVEQKAVIEQNMETPYEIHLVVFASQQDFENYMKDEERKKFLHLKNQSIKAAVLIQGTKL